MNFLRFVALIGALVFVHELGHFVLAKLFGVRVLKFSLGFGPRLVGLVYKGTDYCISLVPFGGFVKMLGEDPTDAIKPEDAAHAFHTQDLWKRFLIVLAGPLMSLVFPSVIYFVVFLGQTELLPPVIGTVVAGHPADGKLLPGDRVLSIDGAPVGSFPRTPRAYRRVARAAAAVSRAAQRARDRRDGDPCVCAGRAPVGRGRLRGASGNLCRLSPADHCSAFWSVRRGASRAANLRPAHVVRWATSDAVARAGTCPLCESWGNGAREFSASPGSAGVPSAVCATSRCSTPVWRAVARRKRRAIRPRERASSHRTFT